MKLTGNELFPAPRNGGLIPTRLADFENWEILLMANTFQQAGDRKPAASLLAYLHDRRITQQAPGPEAA